MSLPSGEECTSPNSSKHLDTFLDCIARLLAKRWLRDQRQQQEEPPPKEAKRREKESLK